jgi:hypothetical protein
MRKLTRVRPRMLLRCYHRVWPLWGSPLCTV